MSDKSIATRIAALMGDIGTIRKDQRNSFHDYEYASADSVYAAIRPLAAKHGLTLVCQPKAIETLTIAGANFAILPVSIGWRDDTVEPSIVPVPLQPGSKNSVRLDAQCVQAAVTYAVKYWLRSTLMLETGDPDADASEQQQVARRTQEPTRNGAQRTQAGNGVQRTQEPVRGETTSTQSQPPEDAYTAKLDGLMIVTSDGGTWDSKFESNARTAQIQIYRFVENMIKGQMPAGKKVKTLVLNKALLQRLPANGVKTLKDAAARNDCSDGFATWDDDVSEDAPF